MSRRVVRRRQSASSSVQSRVHENNIRQKKIVVSWPGAEFGFGDSEIEQAIMFALRYSIQLKQVVHVDHNGKGIAEFDGPYLSGLPKFQSHWPFPQKKNPKRKVVRRK